MAQVEEAQSVFHQLEGVVIAFEKVLLVQIAIDGEEVGDRLGGVGFDFVRRFAAVEVRSAEHVEDQHAVIGHHGSARFRNDRRVRHTFLVADSLDAEDDVVGVFLQRVVHRRFEIGLRTVVVDAEAAADVEVLQPGAGFVQFNENACRFGQGFLHLANIGDLAAKVEVRHLQTVGHVAGFEILKRFENLGDGQAELAAVAGARAPATRTPRRELDAHADDGTNVERFGMADDRFQFGEALDDRDDVLAQLAGENHHLDKFVVLEAVADDRRVVAVGDGEDGKEFRLRARLQAKVERLAKIEDFLDDVPLLVHLDRIDAAIIALILKFRDGGLKGRGDLADAMS